MLVLGFAFLLLALGWAALAVISDSGLAWGYAALSLGFFGVSAGWFLLFAMFDRLPSTRRAALRSSR